MSDPVLTGEVVGFRQWRVTPDLVLRAAAHVSRPTWCTGDNTAECHYLDAYTGERMACKDTPGEQCECGFYGLHSPDDLWYGGEGRSRSGGNLFTFTTGPTDPDPLVSGIIVGWGKIQVHHQGFRSEFARVAALAVPKTKRDAVIVRAVAAEYDVPCVPAGGLARIADEFGSTIPESLRPEKPAPTSDHLLVSGQIFYPPSFHQLGGVITLGQPARQKTELEKLMAELGKVMNLVQAKPGDGQVSEAVRRQPANRQGPPRPQRPPKRLGGPGR